MCHAGNITDWWNNGPIFSGKMDDCRLWISRSFGFLSVHCLRHPTYDGRISQICFGPRGIYFRCPQHLSGRHQLVYVPRHDCCCPWRWWLKILKFGAHFFSRKQNSFWQKKSLKNWVRNPHVLFVLMYPSLFKNPKLKFAKLFLQTKRYYFFSNMNFRIRNNCSTMSLYLLIQKLPEPALFWRNFFFRSDTIVCAILHFRFFAPTIQII